LARGAAAAFRAGAGEGFVDDERDIRTPCIDLITDRKPRAHLNDATDRQNCQFAPYQIGVG
jgi:hypothetical protein